jgi:mono/diheme cytochrome c family protein
VISRLNCSVLVLFLLICTAYPTFAVSKSEAAEEAGAVLFRDKGCVFCHGPGGAGTTKAPSLADIRKDKAWPATRMTSQILNGGQKMPPFRESLDDNEVAAVVAYLRAKHRPVPPPATSTPPAPSSSH